MTSAHRQFSMRWWLALAKFLELLKLVSNLYRCLERHSLTLPPLLATINTAIINYGFIALSFARITKPKLAAFILQVSYPKY